MNLTKPILCIAAMCSACAEPQSTVTDPPDSEVIDLEIQIHLMESSVLSALHSTLTDDEVTELMEGVDRIWDQAHIQWNVVLVLREQALNPDVFSRVLAGALPLDSAAYILPTANLLIGKWDAFLIKSFEGVAGGVYLSFVPAVMSAEIDLDGVRDISGSATRILAHELGHTLGLPHVTCTPAGNLMSPGCPATNPTRLTEAQVTAARRQAARGVPF